MLTDYTAFVILGICLPRNIVDLFPEQLHTGTYVSRFTQEFETLEPNNSSASSILTKGIFLQEGDLGENQLGAPSESAVSSSSDLSASNKRVRKKTNINPIDSINLTTNEAVSIASSFGVTASKHKKKSCLLCCRTRVINNIFDTSTCLNIQEPKDLASQNSKTRDSDTSFYSPESIISDDSANTNMPDRISSTILRNVRKMANPIMYKSCRKILIELKQKYPQSFQDICLYSEICTYMAQCSYRMVVRRFIQEIFLDLKFEAFDNGVELVMESAEKRFSDFNLLNISKKLPSSPVLQSKLPGSFPPPSTSNPISLHKLSSLKSPLLASVYETSIENLMDSPPRLAKDEVDAGMDDVSDFITSPSELLASTQITAEIHSQGRNGNEVESSSQTSERETLRHFRRGRFNTLELDLSCSRNKFPYKNHRSPTEIYPLATSTLQRPVSLNTKQEGQKALHKSIISTSDHSFEASSRKTLTSPISPIGKLFCEQRLLTSSRSEATLSNKRDDFKDETDEDTKQK